MALHFTSTTESLEQMQQDLGLEATPPADGATAPGGGNTLTAPDDTGGNEDEEELDEKGEPIGGAKQAATQPAADKTAAAPGKESEQGEAGGPSEKGAPTPAKAADGEESISARVDRRIAKLVKDRETLEARLRAIEERQAAKPAETKPAETTPAEPAAAAPAVDANGLDPNDPEPQFEDDDIKDEADLQAKHAAWDARRINRIVEARLAADREAREKADREVKEKAELEATEKALRGRVEAFKKDHADYDEAVADVPFSGPMIVVGTTHEQGPALLYHLAQNDEEFERVRALPTGLQVFELGRLAERLASGAPKPSGKAGAQEPAPPKPRISRAPAPVSDVGGGSASTAHEVTDESSYKDDELKWEAELRAGRR